MSAQSLMAINPIFVISLKITNADFVVAQEEKSVNVCTNFHGILSNSCSDWNYFLLKGKRENMFL